MSLSILNNTNKKSQILLSFGYCYAPLWWLVLHVCWFGLGRLRCFPEQSRWEAPRHIERNKHHFGFSVVWWQIADGYFRAQPLSPDSSARLDGCLLPLAHGCRACPAFACAQGFIFSEQKMRFFFVVVVCFTFLADRLRRETEIRHLLWSPRRDGFYYLLPTGHHPRWACHPFQNYCPARGCPSHWAADKAWNRDDRGNVSRCFFFFPGTGAPGSFQCC